MDNNHMPGKVWDEITYPFLNFNGATMLVKGGPGVEIDILSNQTRGKLSSVASAPPLELSFPSKFS